MAWRSARLLYVAVTRAKSTLSIAWPQETSRGYRSGWAPLSRFLANIPETLFASHNADELIRSRTARTKRY